MLSRLVNTPVNIRPRAIAFGAGLLLACSLGCGGGGEQSRAEATREAGATATAAVQRATALAAATASSEGTDGAGPSANGEGPPNGEGTALPPPIATLQAAATREAANRPLPGTLPTFTPLPPSGLSLRLVGPSTLGAGEAALVRIRVEGTSSRPIAAFNFELVYDERLLTLEAPVPATGRLNDASGREFSCNLPPPSADVDGSAAIGRARLVCFSFGEAAVPGFPAPLELATVRLRARAEGTASVAPDSVAFFSVEGQNLGGAEAAVLSIRID